MKLIITGGCGVARGGCSPSFRVKSSYPPLFFCYRVPHRINNNMISAMVRYDATRTYVRYEKTSSFSSYSSSSSIQRQKGERVDEKHEGNGHVNVHIVNGDDDDHVMEKEKEEELIKNPYRMVIEGEVSRDDEVRKNLKDYFQESRVLIRSAAGGSDGGGPRWFSPVVKCGSCLDNLPLLLYLPGIDGVGLGLIRHHHTLGKMFEIQCLHIPVKDRTSFTALVKLVEKTVRSENCRNPSRPVYLVGESLGACIALAVAANNPDIDLVLVLSNPATSFDKSPLQPLIPFMELIPDYHRLTLPYILNLMRGDPLKIAIRDVIMRHPLQRALGDLSLDVLSTTLYLSVLGEILPRETFLWKLQLLKSASASVNARLHAIKAQTLILYSGKDQLLPSEEESNRLCGALSNCIRRLYKDGGHFLFLEEGIDLATTIKGAGVYRKGRHQDCAFDYVNVTPLEFKNIYESHKMIIDVTSPVMFSTTEDGKVVKGLAGIPVEGPVIYVGYHMLLGLELAPLIIRFLMEKNILLRGLALRLLFAELKVFTPEASTFDHFRVMGAVPVSGTNFFKLMSSKSHVLLYPGGAREASHRKGEEYKLFWPERSEFVRMAARFGAKIVPFGAVGEDDIADILLDYDDQMKIPILRAFLTRLQEETANANSQAPGNQGMGLPLYTPRAPGRFYYYFGKPIDTKGRDELRDREKSHELYLQVKREVENCLAFLRDKREDDPYRNLLARVAYQATHGFTSEVPTFEL